ncbi:MAG: hypothetical protein EBT55_03810 [Proteobacteria bacterium]|nr:hypothetical protein [Pseudomonadota bacterium]
MKKIIFAVLTAVALFSACAKKEIQKEAGNQLKDLPEWVLNPSSGVKEGVAGVGIAGPSRGGITVQIPKAELDAKANIASTIQSEISRVTKNALRSAKVNDADDVEEFFAQASKEVVKNLPMSGAKRDKIFKAEDGTLYIRMVLGTEDYSKFLKNSQKEFEDKIAKSNLSRNSITKSQEATKDLFDELEKERKGEAKNSAKEEPAKKE